MGSPYSGYGNYGSLVPSGAFGQIGQVLGGLGASAGQWLPVIAGLMQERERTGRESLQTALQIPDENVRRAAIENYARQFGKSPFALQWPKVNVPGQITTPGQAAITAPATVGEVQAPGAGLDVLSQRGAQRQTGLPPQTITPAVAEVRGPATEQYYVPPAPIGAQTVGQLLGPDNPFFHNMPEAMKARVIGMRWSDAVQVFPDLPKWAEQALRPPVDVAGLVGGAILPGKETEAKALAARVTAAVQRGEIDENQGIALLKQSGYWPTPQETQTAHQAEAQQYQTRIAGALANPSLGDAEVVRIKAEMRARHYPEAEISAVTQGGRDIMAQQRMHAPRLVTIGTQKFTVDETAAANIAKTEEDLKQRLQQQKDEFEQRRLDRQAMRETAAGTREDTRWLHQFDTLTGRLQLAENGVLTAQADVDELERQQKAIAAILNQPNLKNQDINAFSEALTRQQQLPAELGRAQAKLKATQAVLNAWQKRYEAFTGFPAEPMPVPPPPPPVSPPPPPPSGGPAGPKVGSTAVPTRPQSVLEGLAGPETYSGPAEGGVTPPPVRSPAPGGIRNPAPSPKAMAYWRVWQQTHKPIPTDRWNALPFQWRQWLEGEGVKHQ